MVETMRIISIQVPMRMVMVAARMRLLMNIRMVLTFMPTITLVTKLMDRRTHQMKMKMITAMTMGRCRL